MLNPFDRESVLLNSFDRESVLLNSFQHPYEIPDQVRGDRIMMETIEMEETVEIQNKRKEEQSTVGFMIQLYCKGNHKAAWKNRGETPKSEFMCEECRELAQYAMLRSAKCPYIAKGTKTFCNQCKTPCYKPDYRAKIKKVMRYSGPRMMLFMPALCLRHLKLSLKKKFISGNNKSR